MLGAMRLLLLIASVCLTVAGCHTWQVQPGPSSSAVAEAAADSTKQLRLTLTSGAVIEISSPRLGGDSIAGISRTTHQRVAFAVTDVQSVAHKEISAGRTALAAGGITTVALAVLVVVAAVAAIAAFSGSF